MKTSAHPSSTSAATMPPLPGDMGGLPAIGYVSFRQPGRIEAAFDRLRRQLAAAFSFTRADVDSLRELVDVPIIPPDLSGPGWHVHVERIELSAGDTGRSEDVLRMIMSVAHQSPARAVLARQCHSVYHVTGGGQRLVALLLTRRAAAVLLRDVENAAAGAEHILSMEGAPEAYARLIRARRMLQASLGLSA